MNKGIDKPQENWTKFPNCILDNLDKYSGNELKILGLMVRKNIGYTNPNKQFSVRYLSKKLKMSTTTAQKSTEKLLEMQSIKIAGTGERGIKLYDILWNIPTVPKTDTVSKCHSTVLKTDTDLCQEMTQVLDNKVKDTKVKDKGSNLFKPDALFIQGFYNKKSGREDKLNKSKERNIIATVNRYSMKQLEAAIVNMLNDKWSKESDHISLNRLISTKNDKRENNMAKFGKLNGHSKKPDEPEPVQKNMAGEIIPEHLLA